MTWQRWRPGHRRASARKGQPVDVAAWARVYVSLAAAISQFFASPDIAAPGNLVFGRL